tara:strand:+ start:7275 stop:7616 length:342 start_codon:yes stop_codon:yes gene_type:complete
MLYIKKIIKKGRGVFSSVPIKKGELIEKSPSLLIPEKDKFSLENTFLGNYIYADDQDNYYLGLGHCSLYNHSSNPNARFVVTKHYIKIIAIKDISEDEEISIDYGWESKDLDF